MNNPYQAPNSNIIETSLDGQDYDLASKGSRLGAYMIDNLLSGIVSATVLYITGYWGALYAEAASGKVSLGLSLGIIIFSITVYLAINGYLLAKNGQTVGKKLVGIRIQGLDGELIGLPNIILKRLLPIWICRFLSGISAIFSIFILVDVLFIFRADRRCIHDLIAGTRVVVCND